MGRKSKISDELKFISIQAYEEGNRSISEIRNDYGISKSPILYLVRMYSAHGAKALEHKQHKQHNQRYTCEFKRMEVEEYLQVPSSRPP